MSGITKAELQRMLDEVNQKNAKLAADNARLRESLGRRPDGALWIPNATAYFPKGSRTDLVGQTVKVAIPADAFGKGYLIGEVKESKNGNAYCRLQLWIDTSKLSLPAPGERSAADKATKTVKESLDL